MSIICRVKSAVHSGRLNAKDGKRIIEALEKQKAKKPRVYGFPLCPCCGNILVFNLTACNYCNKCGQLIDWSENKND